MKKKKGFGSNSQVTNPSAAILHQLSFMVSSLEPEVLAKMIENQIWLYKEHESKDTNNNSSNKGENYCYLIFCTK